MPLILLTSEFAHHVVETQTRDGVRCLALTGELFASIAAKDNPQGILAVARQRHLELDSFSPDNITFAAAAVSPQDPGQRRDDPAHTGGSRRRWVIPFGWWCRAVPPLSRSRQHGFIILETGDPGFF